MKLKKFISKKPYIISGPCSAESEDQVLSIAHQTHNITDLFRAGIWKPRTKPNSFEGAGAPALKWLNKVQSKYNLKVATEVATPKHVELCLDAGIDVLWIGARTTVNPFYVQEIAEALKGVDIPIFVKNPTHPELALWTGALERFNKVGIDRLGAIHRGVYNYGKSAFRNDPKWSFPIQLRKESRSLPIISDPSHIAGDASLIQNISQTAMDINLDGLMIETHDNPDQALSDSKQQITPSQLRSILQNLVLRDPELRVKGPKNKLLNFRNEIDNLDHQIISLLNDRNQIVKSIADFKKKNKLTVFQIERWFEILYSRKELAVVLGLDNEMIAELFELIHTHSVLTQTKVMR